MFNMGRFLQNIVNSHFIGSISAFILHKYEINNRSPAPSASSEKYFKIWTWIFFPTPIKVLIQKNMFTLLQGGMLWVTWVLSGVQNKVGLWIKFTVVHI